MQFAFSQPRKKIFYIDICVAMTWHCEGVAPIQKAQGKERVASKRMTLKAINERKSELSKERARLMEICRSVYF